MCFCVEESITSNKTTAPSWIDEIRNETNKQSFDGIGDSEIEKKSRTRPVSGRRALVKDSISCDSLLSGARDSEVFHKKSHASSCATKSRPVEDVLDSISFFQRHQVDYI